ncbi:MAG TPA: hypothetical protein VIY72_11180 [Acidimicrobiales bacterium]
MTVLIIVLVVLAIVVVVGALVLNPVLRKKGDAAIDEARAALGGRDKVTLIEPKAVGHGSEPEEAGGLRGQGVLAASDEALTFVTWAPQRTFTLQRSQITGITTSAADARAMDKATIEVAFTNLEGPAKVSFRLPEVARWLDVLGFDWGPEGPPTFDED